MLDGNTVVKDPLTKEGRKQLPASTLPKRQTEKYGERCLSCAEGKGLRSMPSIWNQVPGLPWWNLEQDRALWPLTQASICASWLWNCVNQVAKGLPPPLLPSLGQHRLGEEFTTGEWSRKVHTGLDTANHGYGCRPLKKMEQGTENLPFCLSHGLCPRNLSDLTQNIGYIKNVLWRKWKNSKNQWMLMTLKTLLIVSWTKWSR